MSAKMNVPQLRFREFSGEWEEEKLKKYVLNYKGGAPLKPKDFVAISNYEVIPKKAISSGGKLLLDKENPTFCSETFFKDSPNNIIDSSYLVTTLRDLVPSGPSIGYIVKNSNEKFLLLAQGVYGFKINDNLDENFLIMLSNKIEYRRLMQKIMVGSTQVHIRNKDFFSIQLNLPSKPEQQKIASFLTSVDTKIEQLTKKKTLLEEYKKGVMQKIFARKIRFHDDDGSQYPEWVEKKLWEIGIITTGKTPSTTDLDLWGGDIKFITPTDIKDNIKYQINTQRTVLKQSKMKVLEVGSIVYTCIASIGKMAITKYPSITNQQINSVTVNKNNNNEFIYYQLLKLTPYIQSTQANTTLPIINKTEFSKFKIQIPTLKEQTKIASFLSILDKKIELTDKELNATKEFKKALLQQMFV